MPPWKKAHVLATSLYVYWLTWQNAGLRLPPRRVPVTRRWQFVVKNITEDFERYAELFNDFCADNDARGFLVKQGVAYERVIQVMSRLLEVASPDAPQCRFAIVVREKAYQPSMRCLPGGKIYIDTGFLDLLDSDDELALLLGHEIGHAVAMHGSEVSLRSALGTIVGSLRGSHRFALSPLAMLLKVLAGVPVRQYYVELSYSRKQELEADRIGLMYALRAGYNGKEAIRVWVRLRGHLASVWEPRSTHPRHEKRLKSLRRWLEKPEAERSGATNRYGAVA